MNELETSPFKGDLEAELAAAPRPRALPGATTYLAAGVILVAGFLGGVQAEKAWSDDPVTTPRAGNNPYATRGGQYGFPGPGTAPEGGGFRGGDMTTGTVVKVEGSTVYLRTTDGKTVKVKTSGSTRIQVTGTVKNLKSGAALMIRGTTAQDGTVTATSVTPGTRP